MLRVTRPGRKDYDGPVDGRISDGFLCPPEWYNRAACGNADPEIFFPKSHTSRAEDSPEALALCLGCPVARECRAHGAATESHGIWGGQLIRTPM